MKGGGRAEEGRGRVDERGREAGDVRSENGTADKNVWSAQPSLTNLPEMDFLGTLSNLDLQQDGVDLATHRSGEGDLEKSICSASVQKKKHFALQKNAFCARPSHVLFTMKLAG